MSNNNGSTVLIVEDEALIRMLGVDALEDAGFTVIEAANADEAVALLKGHDDIRLLFSDIDMPGSMNGLALAHLVHEKWPNIRLLLTSGHHRLTDDNVPDDGRFLGKPWQERALVEKVEAILNRAT